MKKILAPCVMAMVMTQQTLAADFSAQVQSQRPNIVLILAEDMNSRLGTYGDPNAITPNIDALANESVVFTHAFTMAGVCAPSRAGLITGMPPQATGLLHMRTSTYTHQYQGVPPSYVKAYPELMRANGYFTYNDTKTDYQFSDGHADVGPFSIWTAHGSYASLDDLMVPAAWENYDLKGKPFFINLNPQITHESGIFTAENVAEIEPAFKELPALWDKLRSHYTLPDIDSAKLKIDPYWQDTAKVRNELALFYKNINVMDQQVGNIINRLKKDKLWENTIVIFAADNGDGLPRHKREGYDSGTHVPLIIYVPEKYRPVGWKAAGEKDDKLVSFEDLAPTILGFSRTAVPFYMKGINLSADNPPTRQYIFSSRGRMDDIYLRSYYVRDRNFQYVQNIDKTPNGANIAFRDVLETTRTLATAHKQGTLTAEQEQWFAPKPAEELYDLQKDPWQLHNMAGESASRSRIALYRQKLEQWRSETNDTGIIAEDQLVKDLQDASGQTRVTLPPVMERNPLTQKVYIANRTDGASIGYSFDGKNWELYTGAIAVPQEASTLFTKAVRYGWKESAVQQLPLSR
ncbi:sulfatase-like hydrolase/transferase [Superficieibacter sp. BNK-5]|uniref:sulfatase-like hydrolase/transferase n=1 Tax=Superficieibacter sp. BNK-5 TaxID=3376142 RepID=UPI0039BF4C0C